MAHLLHAFKNVKPPVLPLLDAVAYGRSLPLIRQQGGKYIAVDNSKQLCSLAQQVLSIQRPPAEPYATLSVLFGHHPYISH